MNATDLDTLLQIVPRGPNLTKITNHNASIVVAMAICQGIAPVEIVMLGGEGDEVEDVVEDVEDVVVVVDTRWTRFKIVLTRRTM